MAFAVLHVQEKNLPSGLIPVFCLLLQKVKRLDPKIKNTVTEFLKGKIPGLLGIYIFGSFANDTSTSNSDNDVGFLTYSKITPVEKWGIQEELSSRLLRDVDVVDLKDASVVLRTEVVDKGIRIYSGNTYEYDSFEMLTYSMYADLNESRSLILNDFKEKYGRNSDK